MAYFIYFAIWFGSVAYNLYMFIFGPLVVSDPDVYFNNALLSFVIGFVGAFPFIWIIQKIEESKAKKEAQEKEAADKKEKAKRARTSKKAAEEQKKELIEKYGEEDGMLIFKRKISEKNYKKKKELIKKYGEEDKSKLTKKKREK